MEGAERTNVMMVNLNQWVEFVLRCNPYTMDVDKRRNCFNCGGFGHLARNYRNIENAMTCLL